MKQIIMFLLATSLGLAVASGFIAFIVLIGIIPRLVAKTKTAKHMMLYENIIILGITTGNLIYLYQFSLPFTYIGMFILAIFAGIFTGCLAGALAEVVNIIPIMARRLRLRKGLPYAIASFALGKGVGTLVQYFVLNVK